MTTAADGTARTDVPLLSTSGEAGKQEPDRTKDLMLITAELCTLTYSTVTLIRSSS